MKAQALPAGEAAIHDDIGARNVGRIVAREKHRQADHVLRLPYPLGFYMKGMDGRIDDASADWKGRGLWVTSGDRTPWHKEGGKGTKPMIVHFQVRPDPLAD